MYVGFCASYLIFCSCIVGTELEIRGVLMFGKEVWKQRINIWCFFSTFVIFRLDKMKCLLPSSLYTLEMTASVPSGSLTWLCDVTRRRISEDGCPRSCSSSNLWLLSQNSYVYRHTYLGRFSSTNTVDMRSSILVMFCCARVDTVLLLDDLTSVTKHNWICLAPL